MPWADRDGNILTDISERYKPAQGQKLYLKGGCDPDIPSYEFQGPDILPVDDLVKRGYELPFYADLPSMPEHERRAIWGLMVGEEGKTKIPILANYSKAGFDPNTETSRILSEQQYDEFTLNAKQNGRPLADGGHWNDDGQFVDPWNRPFKIGIIQESNGTRTISASSFGPDGVDGTVDDIARHRRK